MPAPRRAILANIHERKLDPTSSHTQLDKTGKLVSSKEVVEHEPPNLLFASKQKVVSEIRQEQVKQCVEPVEPVEHVETVQESKVEQPVMEEPLVQEVINEVAEELKVEEVLSSETVSAEETVVEVSSSAETTLGFSKKKSKKKN
jgi:hypothetical protein